MPLYTIEQLRGAYAAGRNAAKVDPPGPGSPIRREAALAAARQELLRNVERVGVEHAFTKDDGEQEHGARFLACAIVNARKPDPHLERDGDEELLETCDWVAFELVRAFDETKCGVIRQAVDRLRILFVEYFRDRIRCANPGDEDLWKYL